jgi:hypothetical protein
MGNIIANWAVAHQGLIEGMALGWSAAHIPWIVLQAFHVAMKIPWLRAQVVSNPKQAKAIVDNIAAELDKDIDAEAATVPVPSSVKP